MANLEQIINESFTQYSGAVLQSRALVDVRDCLKPSARQILYSMYLHNFVHEKPYQKTPNPMGAALADFYIHGNASAVGIMMRAAQSFAMRYPLTEVKGNAGTIIESGTWAADRYTSTRLSEVSNYLFGEIEKDTIAEWRDNYDNTKQYPAVVPSKGYYNIVNGTIGIGIGASCSIPQFNITDVNEAMCKLLDNPELGFEDIYCRPDFATGGIVINEQQVKQSLEKGDGFACRIRSVINYNQKENCLEVTEIPYGVYTNTICKELEEIIESDTNPGIDRFNDMSAATPNIKIYLTKGSSTDKILRFLYKNTSLQASYGINMTMLENGRYPKVFGWKALLQAHIDHEIDVYTRGYNYDLKKILERMHILEGLKKALDHIDEVVDIVKNSTSTKEALAKLQSKIVIDEIQAKAILDLKLNRLVRLEKQKIENEYTDLESKKKSIETILSDKTLFNAELKKAWRAIAKKLEDGHRTQYMDISVKDEEEEIEVKSLEIKLTNNEEIYIKEKSSLYSQANSKLINGEIIIDQIEIQSNEEVLFFTEDGSFYHISGLSLPVNKKVSINSIIGLANWQHVCGIASCSGNYDHLLFITEKGMVKKTDLIEYNMKRKGCLKAIKLSTGDKVISVLKLNIEKIGILTQKGHLLVLNSNIIKSVGRATQGIKGIKLSEDDVVVSAAVLNKNENLVVPITQLGKIKKTPVPPVQSSNTKGVRIQKLGKDDLCKDFIFIGNEKRITIASGKITSSFDVSQIPAYGREAQGNKSLNLKNNDKISRISKFA